MARADLQAELDLLHEAVAAAHQAVVDAKATRNAWMDAHMADFAVYPIGEMLYSRVEGYPLGRVVKYWRARDDESMEPAYHLDTGEITGLSRACSGAELLAIREAEVQLLRGGA